MSAPPASGSTVRGVAPAPGVATAFAAGLGRVRRAPLLVLLVWSITVAAGLPLALGVREDVQRQLGASLQARAVAERPDYEWLTAFADQGSGVSSTLGPAVLGFGAVLDNLDALAEAASRPLVIAATGAMYLLLWTVLAGGLIDRLARDRAMPAHVFLQACGGYGWRLLRLAALSAIVYGVIFTRLHPWLFDDLFPRWTAGLDSERTAFLIRLGLYAVVAVILALTNLVFDYAKVRLVIEDRDSAIGALRASVRFIRRHRPAVFALFLANAVLGVAVLAAYALVAPGATGGGGHAWFAFAIAQLYLAGRLAVKLTFWASEAALFQGHLAHAGYVARPVPSWPDPAAAPAADSGYTLAAIPQPPEVS